MKIIKDMRKNIEEQNESIIKSNFGYNAQPKKNQESQRTRINYELLESVLEHRNLNGITPKFTILRNFLKTKKYVRTIKVA